MFDWVKQAQESKVPQLMKMANTIDGWIKYYNERRLHESLDNLTPKDVYLR